MKKILLSILAISLVSCAVHKVGTFKDLGTEQQFLTNVHQLVLSGKRSGEGYFSADGKEITFQSEREEGNPFYQIYVMNLVTGDTNRISPGYGKTTCSWIHPSKDLVLFASTHGDPKARQKQKEELDFRASGKTKRYAWDYDENFDIWEATKHGKIVRNLTHTKGYDAEGSYSPDGKVIAFSSNRLAYSQKLSPQDKEKLSKDPAYFNDIFIMNSDGSNVKQLTTSPGYDGGPFFSPDGKRIIWRRFSPDGATAEVYTMNIDGTDQKQITHIGAMSWAPYYHPSGDYIIFTTNIHGFDNFELYIVDTAGKHAPVRVSYTPGFDGLPVFTPDGHRLVWSSSRGLGKSSQLFLADWNDEVARAALGLPSVTAKDIKALKTESLITKEDLKAHISYLASDELEGRLTGEAGEVKATKYAADLLQSYGFKPAAKDGSFFDTFEFTSGFSLGAHNSLVVNGNDFQAEKKWVPTSFSANGNFAAAPVVFAGYGMSTQANKDVPEYDSYAHLDVKGKWVIVFRYYPEKGVSEKALEVYKGAASLRYKAMAARDKGAYGVIFVTGPSVKAKRELAPLMGDATLAGTSIPIISVTHDVADVMLKATGKTLAELEREFNDSDMHGGFLIPDTTVSAEIDVQQEKHTGHSVVARLSAGNNSLPAIVIGAHIDHLGHGYSGNSLARDDEAHKIHYGADDNASGDAAVLEIAQEIFSLVKEGKLKLKRDLIVALWSGEELGLLGSNHFVEGLKGKGAVRAKYGAYVNLDMVGRFTDKLIWQGVGSSSVWNKLLEKTNISFGLPMVMQDDSYLPTDSTSFYLKGVPTLSGFTGLHEQYHTPRDVESLINYEGLQKISQFTSKVVQALLVQSSTIDYREMKKPEHFEMRADLRAYLGTIPDYASAGVMGLKISGVMKGGPADKAGLKSGDIIVQLGSKKVENIYDYTFAIEALKVNEKTQVTVMRDGKSVMIDITPESRQ